MRLAYLNLYRDPSEASGGHVHARQFVRCATALGHEVWTRDVGLAEAHRLPSGRVGRLLALRGMDAVILRVEATPPGLLKLPNGLHRLVLGGPLLVWELNTVPAFATARGASEAMVARAECALRRLAPRCDLAVCVSERLAAWASESLGIQRTVTVPNGSDPDLFRPDVPPRSGMGAEHGLDVVWLGDAALGWNDLDLLLGAARLLDAVPGRADVRFHLVGPGQDALPRLPDGVRAHGPVPYPELPAVLSAMDVGVVSYREGPADHSSPLKLYDYMASGLAVVSTPQPQVSKVLGEIGRARFVVAREPRALATALVELADDPGLRAAYSRSAREAVLARHSWMGAARQVVAAIERFTNRS